jgi:beta-lactamase superfamily II metal-dependent hydrolase
MFRVEMLPAAQGDCLWIEYGTRRAMHRLLVDGGTAPTYDHLRARIMRLPEAQRHFDLIIVSHVDADHIEGILVLLQDPTLKLRVDDIWFNGWKHLPSDRLGPAQGEMLSAILERRRPWGSKLPWNVAFGGKAVEASDDAATALPTHSLDGGMRVTLLSPTRMELSILAPYWQDEVRAARIRTGDADDALELLGRSTRLHPRADALGEPRFDVDSAAGEPFKPDRTKANGSSIAVLAEYDGGRCLLAADAHAGVLLKTIQRLLTSRPGLTVDAFKLPHHGSKKNVSSELVAAIPALKYLFSSSGAIFRHPDPQAVARVLMANGGRKELWFNYATIHNELWRDAALLSEFDARAHYPDPNGPGMGISVAL